MGRRSITDKEIGLIRAMTDRGMKNKDIQFLFNRPERAVNSGRITQIRDGSYGQEVQTATDDELNQFLEERRPMPDYGAIRVPNGSLTHLNIDPLDHSLILKFFAKDRKGIWRLAVGETDQHECKLNFGLRAWADWVKAIAAMANNKGGYIFFGVHDNANNTDGVSKSYAVVGLKDSKFSQIDPSEIVGKIRSALDPTPVVRMTTLTIGESSVGVMYVEQHPSRPVIVRNADGSVLREGEILFRYSGRSDRIKYSDLRSILDDRDAVSRRDVLPLLERVLSLGPQRAIIGDLETGIVESDGSRIVIDPLLLDKLKFIKEGHFSEKDGASALRLIGDITKDGDIIPATRIVRKAVTPDAILENFLKEEKVEQPIQYVIYSAYSPRGWQPLWYYIKMARISVADAVQYLKSENASHPSNRDNAVARLQGRRTAYKKNPGRPKYFLDQIQNDEILQSDDENELYKFALAIQGLEEVPKNVDRIKEILLSSFKLASTQSNFHSMFRSAIFRSACRLDELLFR